MKKKKPFAQFYYMLDKAQRVAFFKEAFPLMGVSHSTFCYKAMHGNIYPSEALRIKDVLIKYGCSKETLLSMGIVE